MSNGNLIFSIKTLEVDDGRKLKAVKPDSSGVYRGLPLMILDTTSRNNNYYDPDSVIKSMTDEKSIFHKAVQEGCQSGEWGHPFIRCQSDLDRLCRIEESMVSHRIVAVNSKATSDGTIVVYGDILPYGPYGKYLSESLESPVTNTAFSLRALSTKQGQRSDGANNMKVAVFVTFDAVSMPGYKQATKRYALNVESLGNCKITEDMEYAYDSSDPLIRKVATECFTTESLESQELLDIFQTNTLKLCTQEFVFDEKSSSILKGHDRASFFHTMFKGAR